MSFSIVLWRNIVQSPKLTNAKTPYFVMLSWEERIKKCCDGYEVK